MKTLVPVGFINQSKGTPLCRHHISADRNKGTKRQPGNGMYINNNTTPS